MVATTLLAALGVATAYRYFEQLEGLAEARVQTNLVLKTTQELLSLVKDAESSERGYVLTMDEAYLKPYALAHEQVDSDLEELLRITDNPAASEHLRAMVPLVHAMMAHLARVIEVQRKGDGSAALELIRSGQGDSFMDPIRSEIAEVIRIKQATLTQAEALADTIRRKQLLIVGSAALGTLLSALVFGYLIYQEGRRLLAIAAESNRLQQEASVAMQSSQELLAVTLKSIGDAVVTTDVQGRVTLLNPLAEKLTGWTRALAAGQPIDEVLRLVHQKSRQPATLPVMQMLIDGHDKDLDHHCVLLARDGTEHAIADSCAPIRDAGQRVVGAVMVFRDVTELRRTEAQLEAKADEQQTILDATPALIFYKDTENRFVNVNEAMAHANDKTKAELIGKTCWEIYPKELADAYGRDDQEVISSGQPKYKINERMDTPHGCVYLETDKIPYRDASGLVIGIIGFGVDVSARRQAEDALRRAGALQSAIFNSANFSSIATDANGVIQIFNVGAERMLGYAASEVMNKITPADISDPLELIERAKTLTDELGTPITPGFDALVFKAARGIEDIYELTYIRKDRSRFPAVVSVTALRDAEKIIIGYLLIGTDNTARKKVEEEQNLLDQRLHDQQFYTRSLLEASSDGLVMTDPKGMVTDVNRQMELLTGCTRDELIGAPIKNFFKDPQRAEAGFKLALAQKKLTNYELTVCDREGGETVVSYNATTFYDRERRLQGVFAVARDVTELKRFEHTLQEKNVELEHATRMKSEFLATMSHELRSPLNAIIGFSEALKDGLIGELSAPQTDYIGDIFNSGQHLLSLINDILDLSKIEAGKMTLELDPVDIKSLLSNSLSIIKEKASAHRIQVQVETAEDLGVPRLDLRKTKQIVYNLLSNAVKFTPEGGRATLRARRVPRSAVGALSDSWPVHSFPLAESDYQEFLEISVKDSGIGISVDNMSKLFQPFSQIDGTLARKYGGTGLGLAMVKQMAELHGGAVAVASAVNQGSIFAVWLPLREAAGAVAGPPLSLEEPAMAAIGHAERLALVIENDVRSADLLALLLESEGFSVVRATSAEEALVLGPKQALSLITLDIVLPNLDGWAFLQKIREDSALACVPVVVLAAPDHGALALVRGAGAALQKPVSRAQIEESLEQLGLPPFKEHPRRVLIVDDDPKAVEVLATFLPAPAYAVVRAYGGAEAIIAARRILPDLIVLDLMMPEVSGFDVVHALQQDGDTARIPILVVTEQQIPGEDRARLNEHPHHGGDIVEISGFDQPRFITEVRRATSLHTAPPQ